MATRLFGFWRSLATFRVRIALNLKGIDFDEVAIDLLKGEQFSESYRMVNPQMVVPALVVGESPTLADICLVSHVEGARLFKFDIAAYPIAVGIADECLKIDAFALAHPLRQPGAPSNPAH